MGASRRAGEGTVDWVQTLLRGRPREAADLAFKTRQNAAQETWVVVVDASASTRRHQALSDAKGLLAQVFEDAYRQRFRVAVLQASGNSPQWQVSGAKASKRLDDWLATLGSGGGTPLLQALEDVAGWLRLRRKQLPHEQQRFLLLTDGRLKAWSTLPVLACPGILIDIERGPIRLGKSRQMATELAIDYVHIDETASL
nr:VWA domain-containing protein [uncultured Pseudomonas sp.]